jgi:hypothetical protein
MMRMSTDSMVSTVDQVSRRLGPLNSLVALVADRMAPKTAARGGCIPPGYQFCFSYCDNVTSCCSTVHLGGKMDAYAINIATCESGNYGKCLNHCESACGSC